MRGSWVRVSGLLMASMGVANAGENWVGTQIDPTPAYPISSVTRVVSGDPNGDLVEQERVDTFAPYGIVFPSQYGVVDTFTNVSGSLMVEGDPVIPALCNSIRDEAPAPFVVIETPTVNASATSFRIAASSCPTGIERAEYYIPISNFARYESVLALQQGLGLIQTQLAEIAHNVEQQSIAHHASSAAAQALVTLTPSAAGKSTVHLGYGLSGGQSAVGFTVAHKVDSELPITVDGGIALAADETVTARAGVGFEF